MAAGRKIWRGRVLVNCGQRRHAQESHVQESHAQESHAQESGGPAFRPIISVLVALPRKGDGMTRRVLERRRPGAVGFATFGGIARRAAHRGVSVCFGGEAARSTGANLLTPVRRPSSAGMSV